MKRFTKISLGIAGFFTSVAIICVVIALAMGFTSHDFVQMMRDGRFSIQMGDGEIHIFGIKEKEILEFDWDFFEDEDLGESEYEDDQIYDIKGEYTNLEVEFGAGQLEIYYADVANIQIVKKDVTGFELKTDEERKTICIEGGLHVNSREDAKLTIILPRETSFEKVDLEVGAGQATIYGLIVDKLEVEVGAGQAIIEMAGSEKDYSYKVSCGIGNVEIGNHSFGGFGANQSVQQDRTDKKIEVDCGIGEVIIRFNEDSIV